jgi:hypothetical protein
MVIESATLLSSRSLLFISFLLLTASTPTKQQKTTSSEDDLLEMINFSVNQLFKNIDSFNLGQKEINEFRSKVSSDTKNFNTLTAPPTNKVKAQSIYEHFYKICHVFFKQELQL